MRYTDYESWFDRWQKFHAMAGEAWTECINMRAPALRIARLTKCMARCVEKMKQYA